jgi:hypothetical protein
MLQGVPFPIRVECPPGACVCEREVLLGDPAADMRVLMLTREEEKKLLARIDAISSYAELCKLEERLQANLGVVLRITPSVHEVRTARGLSIVLDERTGLCRKVRQSVPAAIRRCLDRHPEIVYAILNKHDLLG